MPLPGGRIHQAGGWIVEHCLGPLGLGTLIVKPVRHVLNVGDLDDREARALGPLLRDASSVVTRLRGAERVYVSLWSHAGGVPVHIHFVVMPIDRGVVATHGGALGPALQAAMFADGIPPDEAEVEEFAAEARSFWRTGVAARR